jgi:hypothetical protein
MIAASSIIHLELSASAVNHIISLTRSINNIQRIPCIRVYDWTSCPLKKKKEPSLSITTIFVRAYCSMSLVGLKNKIRNAIIITTSLVIVC